MNDDKERLYQFGINASGGVRYTGDNATYIHTLQLFMDRKDAIELLIALANELKSNDSAIRVELGGKMWAADIAD